MRALFDREESEASGPAFPDRSFYRKADIAAPDEKLRRLRETNINEASARTPHIAALVEKVLGRRVASVQPLSSQGTFHLVHEVRLSDGAQLIFRSSLPELIPADSAFEVEQAVVKKLTATGLPVVPILATADGAAAPFSYQIMSQAPGSALSSRDRDAVDSDPPLLACLGGAVASLGRIPGTGFGPLQVTQGYGRLQGSFSSWRDYAMCRWEDHLAQGERLSLWEVAQTAEIDNHGRGILPLLPETPGSLIHGDLGNHNIFVEGQTVFLIDWEDAMLGDPTFDAAMWASFHLPRAFGPFLDSFRPGWRDDEIFRARFAFYFFRIVLAKAIHRHRFGYADVPGRPTMRQRMAEAREMLACAGASHSGFLVA
ncbi:MAG TPA: aminoglycoside phosphotransferase family protein [Dongiaceae bacterium]|jgi:aminoglycoside phosphotransferase (APT) family kinase protein|nr:aminoglycoside phosphotransferase family protein [Dongiaceae bacterium]